jgi:hypothetical protein
MRGPREPDFGGSYRDLNVDRRLTIEELVGAARLDRLPQIRELEGRWRPLLRLVSLLSK